MALLNRLFSSRRKPFAKAQDNASEKLFTFSNDQVRVIVFRECDFRGRKLLFDSKTVRKDSLAEIQDGQPEQEPKKYVEKTGTHAYSYTKPCGDVSRLGEMIFGSVAMSFRGTTYKIHSIPAPSQLVCSQVFPSPKNPVRMRRSAPSHVNTGSSIEQSIRLEDSGASSATSGSDQSVLSGASDTILVCKRQHSVPLDVPANFSLVSSSGYGEEQSCSSVSSGPQSIPVDLSQGVHSGDSLSKRWPCWNTSGSMDPSASSLPGSASTEESFRKARTSKIGLAVLIELTDGEEEKLEQFLMEHAALIEMMMWRVRRGVEGAYLRHNTFVSIMHTISAQTARWLYDLVSGARNLVQTWHSHFPNCDNLFSIIENSPSVSFLGHFTGSRTLLHTDSRDAIRFSSLASGNGLFSSFKSESNLFDGGELSFTNISRFLKHDGAGGKKDEGLLLAEKFVKEFCELLETVDVKHTNFFISTLVTAVLTHHLGWVNTVLPVALKQNQPPTMNPFWSQLTELYGAIGHPLKMSRTVIAGSQKTELVPKVLNALKYFIRCTEVSRHYRTRVDVDRENASADSICAAKSCIPKENYKKYEDHLREIEAFTKAENQQQGFKLKTPTKTQQTVINNNAETLIKPQKKLSLVKTHTCLNELDKMCEHQEKEKHTEILDKVTNLGLQAINPGEKIDVECRFLQNVNVQQLVDFNEAKLEIERVFSPKKKTPEIVTPNQKPFFNFESQLKDNKTETTLPQNETEVQIPLLQLPEDEETAEIAINSVVFVLGDDEKLVGIKREPTPTKLSFKLETISADSTPPEASPTLIRADFISQYLDHNSNQHDQNASVKKGLTKSKTYSKELNTSTVKDNIIESSNINKDESDISAKIEQSAFEDNSNPVLIQDNEFSRFESTNIQISLNIPDSDVCNIQTNAQNESLPLGLKKSKTVSRELKNIECNKQHFELSESLKVPKLRKSNTVSHEFYTFETNVSAEKENNNFIQESCLDVMFTKNLSNTFKNKENVLNESTRNELIITNTSNKKTNGLRKSKTVGKELNIAAENKVKSLSDLNAKLPCVHCPLDKIQFPKYNVSKRTDGSVSVKNIPETLASSDSAFGVDTVDATTSFENLLGKRRIGQNVDESELMSEGLASSKTIKTYQKCGDSTLQMKDTNIFKSEVDMPIFDSSNLNAQFTEFLVEHNPADSSFSKSLELTGSQELAASIETCVKQENMNESVFQAVCENMLYDTAPFKDGDFTECLGAACIKPSSSFTQIQLPSPDLKGMRAASEPPNREKQSPSTSTRYKYSGVKFNFQQYPQIVENYMKNKNIELSNMQFAEKKLDSLWQSSSGYNFPKCDEAGDDFDEGALTTPSNASELEFTSELVVEKIEGKKAEEVLVEQPRKQLEFTRNVVANTVIKEPHSKNLKDVRRINEEAVASNLKIVEIPMPKSVEVESHFPSIDYTNTLIQGLDNHYISDMVLQGTTSPKNEWEQSLKKDLLLSTQHAFSNQQIEESLAIVANTDTWEVQLMSSHTYVIDRSSTGVPVGMSQLVANMLETLLHMWRLHTPAEYCLMHIEQQLQEFCLRSKALAQFLLDTDFCSMEILTSALRLEVNDVPLLMAIASTHTPQVTQKYGLSFQ